MYNVEKFNEFYNSFSNYNYKLFKHIHNIDNKQRKSILDVACGTGLSTSAIKLNYPKSRIDAFDIDSSMIDFALDIEELKDINFFVHDAEKPQDLNSTWDLIIVKSSLHLFFDSLILEKYLKLLNKDGVLCILETTHTSIDTYPILLEAKNKWKENIPIERKESILMKLRNKPNFDFISTSFGCDVKIVNEVFNNAIKSKQISCLWGIADEQIKKWISSNQESFENINIFAEFDVFLLKSQ